MSVRTITPTELGELCRRGQPIELIDVRTPAEYREVHAEFARSVPLDSLDPRAVMEARNGLGHEPLYTICRSGSRGRQACEKFLASGYANLVNVEGGTRAAFYSTEDGRDIQAFLIDYVADFVKIAAGPKFNPHVTTGVGTETYLNKLLAEPFDAFTFSAVGASVYQLGSFGTARKELKALALKS